MVLALAGTEGPDNILAVQMYASMAILKPKEIDRSLKRVVWVRLTSESPAEILLALLRFPWKKTTNPDVFKTDSCASKQ